jgi:DNA-binding protein H-NS
MKRLLCMAVLGLSASLFPVCGQDGMSAAAAAARQGEVLRAYTERFNTFQSDLELLQKDNVALREEISRLSQENSQLRADQAKTASAVANVYNPEKDLKRLADAINEVDRKRDSDRREVTEEFKRAMSKIDVKIENNFQALSTALASRPTPKPPRPADPPASSSQPVSDVGYTHVVQSGQSFLAIVKAYNAKFKEQGLKTVSVAQVKAANPKLDIDKPLRVGVKLIIPAPAGSKD